MKLDIKLGYHCNNDCIHCVIADNRAICETRRINPELSTDAVRKELADSRQRGCTDVVFTGGEPTVRNDLPYLVDCAAAMGYRVDLQSNGRRFCSEDYARALASITPLSLCIALHGPSGIIHDAITRREGSFSETCAGIVNLLRSEAWVVGKIVISRKNAKLLAETVELYEELGVRDVTVAFPHALGNARLLFDEVVPRYAHVVESARRALEYGRARDMQVRMETFPLCTIPGFEEHAVELQFYDQETELKQLGHQDGPLDWKRARPTNKMKFAQCLDCCFDLLCEGPWEEYGRVFGGSEFTAAPGRPVESIAMFNVMIDERKGRIRGTTR